MEFGAHQQQKLQSVLLWIGTLKSYFLKWWHDYALASHLVELENSQLLVLRMLLPEMPCKTQAKSSLKEAIVILDLKLFLKIFF